jgi:hypothetical protein
VKNQSKGKTGGTGFRMCKENELKDLKIALAALDRKILEKN